MGVNGETTAAFMALSAHLYEQTLIPQYLSAATLSADFVINHLYGGKIKPDGINVQSCSLSLTLITYNSGFMVGGLSVLTPASGSSGYSSFLLKLILTAVIYPHWINTANGVKIEGAVLTTPYPYSTTYPPSPQIHTPPEPEIRRRRMAKLAWTFGEDILPPEYVFPADSEGKVCEKRVGGVSRFTPRSIPPRSTPRARLNPTSPAPSHSARSAPRKSSRVWTTCRDGGLWLGEWNRKDISEVQSRLRALQVR
ncbi:hypothetical protein BDY19DRAFT_998793 [Irpex rosettiformis]|uniref:Uncharacterized protein n=1 Tax=Irpex rosettiformis TaxID=378272 RepID=A0ACB8TME5_9APHY|nr:hypothetical protein BDY19DRAFT_998793 [Irpex rosettiformis]